MEKGFTLIELLAVIVILAVIAIIVTPLIASTIENSEKASRISSARNYESAVEQEITRSQLTDSPIKDGTYPVSNFNGLVKGTLPTSGNVTILKGLVDSYSLAFDDYTVVKKSGSDELTATKSLPATVYANGTAVYFNPITGNKCTAGEAVSTTGTKTGCMKWYTFNDGGASADTINLILDHNTTAVVAWNSSGSNLNGPVTMLTALQNDTSTWTGVAKRNDSYTLTNGTANYTIDYSNYRARLISVGEIAKITGNNTFDETKVANWFFFDSNTQTQVSSAAGASSFAWLFDYTSGCTNGGCNFADNSNYGYWTATAVAGSSVYAWRVNSYGDVTNDSNANLAFNSGLRPVITILKSSL